MNFLSAIFNMIGALACNLPLIILGFLGLCFLVVIHEFGHFIFCKFFNIYVPSFSIGFGPRLIEKKIGETVFAISAIPLGGYVEIAGSQEVGQGEQIHAKETGERSFATKPYWQKMCVMIGGILFNVLFTYLTIALLFYLGTPCFAVWCEDKQPVIGIALEDKAASKAGLKFGDKILAVNNENIKNITQLTEELKPLIDKQASLKILRNKEEMTLDMKIEGQKINANTTIPAPGIIWYVEPMSLKKALIESFNFTWSMTKKIFSAFINIFKHRDQLGGPLIIIQQIAECASMGYKTFLFILAFISINLAILNVFPLPIFDGGQALTYTIEAILKRPLSDELKYKIHYFFWIVLILLVVYLTYKDIIKITGKYFEQLKAK